MTGSISFNYYLICSCRARSKVQKIAITQQDLQEVGPSQKVVKKEFLEQLIVKIKGKDISKQEEKWTKALETETSVMCPSKVITS